jgi:sugar lactone lactonase YvrE
MVVDARGRAWVGNWGFDLNAYLDDRGLLAVSAVPDLPTAALARVDPDGAIAIAATGLRFPNGTVVTPDGATLIVAETFAERLTAFDIGADGTLTNSRVWAELPGVVPDGLALDAEEAIWVANPIAPECLRVSRGGTIRERVATSQPCYACALGGPDRAKLFLLTNPPFDAAAIGVAAVGSRPCRSPCRVPGGRRHRSPHHRTEQARVKCTGESRP